MRPKKIHRSNCDYNYTTTDETFELEEIIDVYGHIDNQQNGRTSQNLNGNVNTYSCVTDVKTQYETSGPKTNFSPAKTLPRQTREAKILNLQHDLQEVTRS